MHVFLTGEIQIGKTTVISKTLTLINGCPLGFKTYFGPDRSFPEKLLYMNSADEPEVFRDENAIVRFRHGYSPEVETEKFNTFGVELIRYARTFSNLIIMDECGNLEEDAFTFQREIIDTLNGDKPIFGVVKLAGRGWTDALRNHPKSQLIFVTKENRNVLPNILADYFKMNMNKPIKCRV